jgi:hypothetical protein
MVDASNLICLLSPYPWHPQPPLCLSWCPLGVVVVVGRLATILEEEHTRWERRYLANSSTAEENEALAGMVQAVLEDRKLIQFVRDQ